MTVEWHKVFEAVRPYIVRIETSEGTGTGFLFGYNEDRSLCAIATAAHVVSRAHRWRQPISLIHETSGQELFLTYTDRIIDLDIGRDAASIVVPSGSLPFPEKTLRLFEAEKSYKRVGIPLGWAGYPGIVYPQVCFFRGYVSAFLTNEDAYLLDGVAISGVSGGPVFASKVEAHEDKLVKNIPELVGVVSAYVSNVIGTRTLPGLSRAQDVSPFYITLQKLKNMDDAKKHEAIQPPLPPEKPAEPPPVTVTLPPAAVT